MSKMSLITCGAQCLNVVYHVYPGCNAWLRRKKLLVCTDVQRVTKLTMYKTCKSPFRSLEDKVLYTNYMYCLDKVYPIYIFYIGLRFPSLTFSHGPNHKEFCSDIANNMNNSNFLHFFFFVFSSIIWQQGPPTVCWEDSSQHCKYTALHCKSIHLAPSQLTVIPTPNWTMLKLDECVRNAHMEFNVQYYDAGSRHMMYFLMISLPVR